jgi:hypothetical protein
MIRKPLLVLVALFVLLIASVFAAEWWLERHFAELINSLPDREQEITFSDIDFHPFFKGIDLADVQVTPLAGQSSGGSVSATMHHARISGLKWRNLVFSKELSIEEIVFQDPEIRIHYGQVDTAGQQPRRAIQGLFRDILSRGRINNFSITNGNVITTTMRPDTVEIGRVHRLELNAQGIVTDSVRWQYLVPFETKSFTFTIDSLWSHENEDVLIRTGAIRFDEHLGSFSIRNVEQRLRRSWVKVSKAVGHQTDIIAFTVDSVSITGMAPLSNADGTVDLRAKKVWVEGLDLHDHRNKNLPRGLDKEMPMFQGMMASIPIVVDVDSIVIHDASLSYAELLPGRAKAGSLRFTQLNGTIVDLTTLPQRQVERGALRMKLSTKLNGGTLMQVELTVPYDRDAFQLTARMREMDLKDLNSTLGPMTGVEIRTGDLHRLELTMHAEPTYSMNRLVFDYTDLQFNVLDEKAAHARESNKFLSVLAGSLARKDNMPNTKRYKVAEYRSPRNRHRGPFNFMWTSVKEGIAKIVPSRTARALMKPKAKKNKK